MDTPFEEGFAALTRPDPVVVSRGVVVADGAEPRFLGGLHGQAPLLVGAGHPLPDAVAPVIRARPVDSKKKTKKKQAQFFQGGQALPTASGCKKGVLFV